MDFLIVAIVIVGVLVWGIGSMHIINTMCNEPCPRCDTKEMRLVQDPAIYGLSYHVCKNCGLRR